MANPILEFANKNKNKIGIEPIANSPIQNFVNRKKAVATTTNKINTALKTSPVTQVKKPEEKPTLWQRVTKQLMKPVGSVAAETEALGKFIGTGQPYIPGQAALDVLVGKKETSFSDVWRQHAPGALGISENTAGKIGLVFDIADDPLNVIGCGLTKVGKVAEKVTSLSKAGKEIKEGSKIAKQITKLQQSGKVPQGIKGTEALTLGATKAEQAAKGQRGLLNIAGKPLIKGQKLYEATGTLKAGFGATKVGTALRTAFTTKTGSKELDEVISQFKNLSDYRKKQVINTAIDIEKSMRAFKPDQVKLVVQAIENPLVKNTITDQNTMSIVDRFNDLFAGMKTTEKEKGVLFTELKNYFPHIRTKESFGEKIKSLFNSKEYSAALRNAKEQRIQRVLGEKGEELIGDYKKLGLSKLRGGQFRNKLEEAVAKKVNTLQKMLDALTSKDIEKGTSDLRSIIADLKQNISKEPRMIGGAQELVEATERELDDIIKSILYPKRDEMQLLINDLEEMVKTSQGKEFLKPVVGFKNTKESKIKWAYEEIIKTQNKLADDLKKADSFDFVDKLGNFYKRAPNQVEEINQFMGKEFFQTNPVLAYSTRGVAGQYYIV